MAGEGVGDGVVGADWQAVEANDAATHVNAVVVEVDALGFAGVDAAAALGAAVGVDVDMEGGAACHEAEGGGEGAEGVAEEAAASVGEESEEADGECCTEGREGYGAGGECADEGGIEAVGVDDCGDGGYFEGEKN